MLGLIFTWPFYFAFFSLGHFILCNFHLPFSFCLIFTGLFILPYFHSALSFCIIFTLFSLRKFFLGRFDLFCLIFINFCSSINHFPPILLLLGLYHLSKLQASNAFHLNLFCVVSFNVSFIGSLQKGTFAAVGWW